MGAYSLIKGYFEVTPTSIAATRPYPLDVLAAVAGISLQLKAVLMNLETQRLLTPNMCMGRRCRHAIGRGDQFRNGGSGPRVDQRQQANADRSLERLDSEIATFPLRAGPRPAVGPDRMRRPCI